MTTLEERARRAAQAIHDSAVEYTPAASFAVAVRRQRWAHIAQGALAFAAVVVFLAAGALLRPTPGPDVAEETPDPIVEEMPETESVLPEIDAIPSPDAPIDPPAPGPVEDAPTPSEPTGDVPPETQPPVTEPADTTPPEIAITTPKDGDRFEVTTIWFEGVTEPGAAVAAGRWNADVDRDGNWAIKLVLAEGANRAVFTATDLAGNEASASVVVYYDPPPKDDKPDEWEFTANQVFGSCAESPPYDVFWGSAQPGTIVSITSEYGSGSVEANAEGDWEVKVFFEEAPIGKVFAVKVKDVHGSKRIFEFVHTEA